MAMKVEYVTPNKMKASFEAAGEKELFEQLAHFQEVFVNNSVCGHCDESDVVFNVREAEGNKFYEKACTNCGHKFRYGQHKVGGTLFPDYSKGWHKWVPGQEDMVDEKTRKALKK